MSVAVYNVSTAILMVLMLKVGLALVGRDTLPHRRIPWVTLVMTVIAIGGLIVQHTWSRAYGLLDDDPSKRGWWRPLTAVFMQNGGVVGDTFNLITLVLVGALAEWFWGRWLMPLIFLTGAVLPGALGSIVSVAGPSSDPRNFAGSSAATYFLAASLAGAMILTASSRTGLRIRLLALAVPLLGLVLLNLQNNDHGLLAAEGFVLGLLAWLVGRRFLHPDRDLRQPSRLTVGRVIELVRRGPSTGSTDRVSTTPELTPGGSGSNRGGRSGTAGREAGS